MLPTRHDVILDSCTSRVVCGQRESETTVNIKKPRTSERLTRQTILEATWRLIATRGYHNVRVSDIAESCRTSTGTIHYYFAQKNDVLTEAMRFIIAQVFERQELALASHSDAQSQLLHLIDLQLPREGMSRDEWSIWLQYWSQATIYPAMRDIHDEAYSRWLESLTRMMQRGQEQGVIRLDTDPEAAARRFMALTDGLGLQVLTHAPGTDVMVMREVLVDYIEVALAPREAIEDASPPTEGRARRLA